MNLEDIQPWVVSLLRAEPGLAGVPIIADDGTYPKTPDREHALKTRGIVIVVWQIESEGLVDGSSSGAGVEEISIAIVVEENAAVARRDGQVGVTAERALRCVRKATLGKRPSAIPGPGLYPADPPFKNLGTQQGVLKIVALALLRQPIIG